ncbi:MAG: NUDIX hydrolase [archaeon]|nr:MAG: NUDIX hydrolase [archaeon]
MVYEKYGTKGSPEHKSCGGIVFKKDSREVLLLKRSKEKWGKESWHLPKRTTLSGEKDKQTVERGVLEETGWEVKAFELIGELKSTFRRAGTDINKTTYYYRCEPVKKITDEIEVSHNSVEWVQLDEAIKRTAEYKEAEHEDEILTKFKEHILH